jgi:hypothetical protein
MALQYLVILDHTFDRPDAMCDHFSQLLSMMRTASAAFTNASSKIFKWIDANQPHVEQLTDWALNYFDALSRDPATSREGDEQWAKFQKQLFQYRLNKLQWLPAKEV